ncbi:MAG: sugar nucleotide-binding protein, partial [Anderseniella sp.]|nr:sugar nucleotide-binding protein [Anderseniella sp.]
WIASIAAQLLDQPDDDAWGTYHLTHAGQTTWCGFARAIFAYTAATGRPPVAVNPISTAEYPTPAVRPAWSALDCSKVRATFGLTLRPWEEGLSACMANILHDQVRVHGQSTENEAK